MGGFKSPLPAQGFEKLTNIKTLIISKQSHWDFEKLLDQLKNLKNLENLELSFNEISEVPKNIQNLAFLKKISLEFNLLDDSEKHQIESLLPNVKIIW